VKLLRSFIHYIIEISERPRIHAAPDLLSEQEPQQN
jgi:hypothetical protein